MKISGAREQALGCLSEAFGLAVNPRLARCWQSAALAEVAAAVAARSCMLSCVRSGVAGVMLKCRGCMCWHAHAALLYAAAYHG